MTDAIVAFLLISALFVGGLLACWAIGKKLK